MRHTITGNKTIDLTTVDATLIDGGLYFIFIDATDGTLSASRTPWTLNDTKVLVALLLWHNGMTPKYWIGEERHSCLIDRREHYREHHTEGTKAIVVGALAGYTLDSDVNANKVFSIGTSRIMDEDIIVDIAQLTKPNGTATDSVVL